MKENELHEAVSKATVQANTVFSKMRGIVEDEVKRGATQLNVLEIVRKSGLEINEATLQELHVDPVIAILPWLDWCCYFPWRPFWCWWWNRYYPWYRCCPWWWYRCHWYPSPL
ncbi:MAG TPA: hypothetical protein VHM88_10555 [Candidatus Acidoferrales bacterium]|nr:hypothetical protein [Candidatus Acidoferrales bacterium]